MRLATSTSSSSGDQRRVTRARPRPPCLSALVRPSCTSRNAVRSTPGASGPRSPSTLELDLEAGVARARDERAEALERRLRGVLGVLAVGAQDAQQPAHLGQRLAARGLDGAQRADRGLGVAVEHAPRRAGLDDHHRDRVRDDVVQLARDPHALARHRVALALGPLALELLGARGELGGQARAAARDAAQGPAADEDTKGKTMSRPLAVVEGVTARTSASTPASPASARCRGTWAPSEKLRTARASRSSRGPRAASRVSRERERAGGGRQASAAERRDAAPRDRRAQDRPTTGWRTSGSRARRRPPARARAGAERRRPTRRRRARGRGIVTRRLPDGQPRAQLEARRGDGAPRAARRRRARRARAGPTSARASSAGPSPRAVIGDPQLDAAGS